ncbi:hypothetical protein [Aerolutibacter daejeonensis]|uniref:hypothetical protein n=1 Tax=Aerolutibacter daejeonensis TaxID=346181 RepID=UPI0012EC242A|nr:hypothetical protein [Lysobacter daejeonensis]
MKRLQGKAAPATACHVHRGGDRRDKPIARRGVSVDLSKGSDEACHGVVPR